MKKLILLALFCAFLCGCSLASAATSEDWAELDPQLNGIEGTSIERACQKLALQAPATPVIVAMIEGGVDTSHPDLQGRFWINAAEKGGKPGVDDDSNGFVDDVHGWNFLGGKDGQNLGAVSLEVTREVSRLRKKAASVGLSAQERIYLGEVEAEYQERRAPRDRDYQSALSGLAELESALTVLRQAGLKEEKKAAIEALPDTTPEIAEAKRKALKYIARGTTTTVFHIYLKKAREIFDTLFNLDFSFGAVTGDDPEKLDDFRYGNADVVTPYTYHGTHVAGILARPCKGEFVRIMPIRAIPAEGDERDKDVANAIRYAVDNGARIINMSFTKSRSPHEDLVQIAIRYAEEHDVLLVHSSGNDRGDNDRITVFPRSLSETSSWIEVGATSARTGPEFVGKFSNYGRRSVDLFAPGVDIVSTIPGGRYASESGTSLAAPHVARVAALVWSQAPQLKARDVRDILKTSVRTYPSLEVLRPGSTELVDFASLSNTGGVVSAYQALKALGF